MSDDTLQRGIQAARAGDKLTASRLIKRAVHQDPDDEQAWLWMAAVTESKEKRLFCLNRALEINPESQAALEGFQLIGVEPPAHPDTPAASLRIREKALPAEDGGGWFNAASYVAIGAGCALIVVLSVILVNTYNSQVQPVTAAGLSTPEATSIDRPTNTPLPNNTPLPPTSTRPPTAPPTPTQIPINYTVQIDNMGDHLRDIYQRGQQMGRDPHAFSKVGDCHSYQEEFFHHFDTGAYNLGTEYAYLEPTIDHFAGSFSRESISAFPGYHMDTMIDPFWSLKKCNDRESVYKCEIRMHNPSIVMIYVQPHLIPDIWSSLFQESLDEAVTYALEQGIIPVLGTQFIWEGHDALVARTNEIILEVAEEHNVPVWDFYTSSANLGRSPDRGNWHLAYSPESSTDFTDPYNMQHAMTIRNLEGLQILHMIMNDVMEAE